MNPLYSQLAPYLCRPTVKPSAHPGETQDELWFRVGYDTALVRGERLHVGTAAFLRDETVYLPLLPFCVYTAAVLTVRERTLTLRVGTKTYTMSEGQKKWSEKTALRHAPLLHEGRHYLDIGTIRRLFGLKQFYNYDIGVLVFSDKPMNYLNDDYNSLNIQVYRAADLLFDPPAGKRLYEDMCRSSGEQTHPKMYADQSKYDELHALYTHEPVTENEKKMRPWLDHYVSKVKEDFASFFETDEQGRAHWKGERERLSCRQPYYIYDEKGNRLVGKSEYTYTNDKGETITEKCSGSGYGDGYDYGGRSWTKPCAYAAYFSFLWQITREVRYRDATWLMMQSAGTWEHWGEGHFLDCAGAMSGFAVAMDRIWHAFDDEPEKREEMARILYEKGLHAGAVCIRGEEKKVHISTINRGSWRNIHRRANNWNSVCSGGLIAAATVLMSFEKYRAEAEFVAQEMLAGTKQCLYQYAPDGAYIESPSYWAYGTSSYMDVLMLLHSVFGNTYGFLDTIGLLDSFSFACNICDPNGHFWGYHDGDSASLMPGSSMYLASLLYHDPNPARFRDTLLSMGQDPWSSELLYWREGMSDGGAPAPLDYHSKGIETVTFRNTWERENFNFVGLHAGANWALHGDADSGNFIVRMGGVTWFDDPGCENYNVGGYWGDALRYRYYNKSLEGHNCLLALTDKLPMGQVFNRPTDPHARIVRCECAPGGAFAVADMTAQYGEICERAARGLWLTENRCVTVVQDEITLREPTDLLWIATPEPKPNRWFHREHSPETQDEPPIPPCHVTYSDDKRVAFVHREDEDKTVHTLRVTIVSDNKDLHFEEIPENTTVFAQTITRGNSGNKLVSDSPRRIAIRAKGVKTLSLAVVFELCAQEGACAYRYLPMEAWKN